MHDNWVDFFHFMFFMNGGRPDNFIVASRQGISLVSLWRCSEWEFNFLVSFRLFPRTKRNTTNFLVTFQLRHFSAYLGNLQLDISCYDNVHCRFHHQWDPFKLNINYNRKRLKHLFVITIINEQKYYLTKLKSWRVIVRVNFKYLEFRMFWYIFYNLLTPWILRFLLFVYLILNNWQ